MEYVIPPWLNNGPQLVQTMLEGKRIRQNHDIALQELNQRRQQSDAALAMRAQENQQDNLIKQQELEISKAYHDQLIDIQKGKLEQAQEMNDLKTQQAAKMFQIGQRYKQLASTMDPNQAWTMANYEFGGGGIGSGVGPIAAAGIRAAGAQVPEDVTVKPLVGAPNPDTMVAQRGKWTQVLNKTPERALPPAVIKLKQDLANKKSQLLTPDLDEDTANYLKSEIKNLEELIREATPGGSSKTTPTSGLRIVGMRMRQ